MDLLKQLRKILGDDEIPVPEGHRRRHKGQTHLFVRPEACGTVAKRLVEAFGPARFATRGLATAVLSWDEPHASFWLPDPRAPFAVLSF